VAAQTYEGARPAIWHHPRNLPVDIGVFQEQSDKPLP